MATKKTTEKKTEDNRARAFATIIYPDSLPADWLERLKGTMWKGFVSPLHDKDVNEGGTPKKPHYHVLIMFDGNSKKNYDTQIKPVFEKCFENGFAGREEIQSTQGYARYLCHLDNPEKAQYDKNDVIAFGGANYITTINCAEDNSRIQKEILAFIDDNGVMYFHNLVSWCMSNNEEWYQFLSKNCYFTREYLKSKNAEYRDLMYGRDLSAFYEFRERQAYENQEKTTTETNKKQ